MTPAGYEHVREFTRQQPKPIAIRDDLLVMVQALDAGDTTTVRDAVAQQIHWATDKLTALERLRIRMLGDRSEEQYLADTQSLGPYLTLLRGIAFEHENIHWAEHALTLIDQRFGQ